MELLLRRHLWVVDLIAIAIVATAQAAAMDDGGKGRRTEFIAA